MLDSPDRFFLVLGGGNWWSNKGKNQMKSSVAWITVFAASASTLCGCDIIRDPEQDALVAAVEIINEGSKLSAHDVAKLEQRLNEEPRDVTSRVKLLGFYFEEQHRSVEARRTRAVHILWLVENHPAHAVCGLPQAIIHNASGREPEAHGRLRDLWEGHVKEHPKDTRILSNAASFYTLTDRPRAIELYRKCADLEPNNPRWPKEVAWLEMLAERFGE